MNDRVYKPINYAKEFVLLCETYPAWRVHRVPAYEIWRQLHPDAATAAAMLEWVVAMSEHPDWQAGSERAQYVPSLSHWLEERRWEDPVALPPMPDSAYPHGIKNFTYVCPVECGHYPFGAGQHHVNALVAQRTFHVEPSFGSMCSSKWVPGMFAMARHLIVRIPSHDLFELAEPWSRWQEGRRH